MTEVLVPGAAITRVLVVEDDPGDAALVRELLADSEDPIEARWARSIADARAQLGGVACVLLDLGLPDAEGLDAVREILAMAPGVAVVVLTGLADHALALSSVAAGAQDYLAKGQIDVATLTRSVRYAVARKRADETARRLFANQLVAAESARLERGLLPRPLLGEQTLRWASCYRSGGGSILLGGDFFDAVELPDGRLRLVIGDVAGHGPDEAAVGVALRIAWRSLVLAGLPEERLLTQLQAVLDAERDDPTLFVTLCDATLDPRERRLSLRVAGHPPPFLLRPHVRAVPLEAWGPPLGVLEGASWPTVESTLPPGWALLFYTDGIVEGRRSRGSYERWGPEGLRQSVEAAAGDLADLDDVADRLIEAAEAANGGPLPDDVALVLVAEPTP